MDYGVRGIDPEPRAGWRLTSARDRNLEEFSNAVWQRHEAHGANRPAPDQWPGGTFQSEPLLVALWKIASAAAGKLVDEIELDLLNPKPAPAVDWHQNYALELAGAPALASGLEQKEQGDGIELVLELADLTLGERAVMRAWLYNPDLAAVAADLNERPQTVILLHRNALYRLAFLGRNPASGGLRGNVSRQNEAASGRARDRSVQRSAPVRRGPDRLLERRRRSRSGRIRGVFEEAAAG